MSTYSLCLRFAMYENRTRERMLRFRILQKGRECSLGSPVALFLSMFEGRLWPGQRQCNAQDQGFVHITSDDPSIGIGMKSDRRTCGDNQASSEGEEK